MNSDDAGLTDTRPRSYGLAIAFGVALCACGGQDGSLTLGEMRAAVRGGSASLSCEWPAVVALDRTCSGTLVHPEVVVYAAHCGAGIDSVAFGEDVDQPERVVETRHCEAHPDAALGNGFDVAFCLLAEPVEDIPSLPIAAGCELDTLRPGLNATLVGFGLEREGGAFGIKRSASVVIGQTGADLTVEPAATGTCAGDSGGPLVMQTSSAPGVAPQPRLLGISSAASARGCEPSTDHYSYVPALLPWLESESGRDLTPCFATDSSWAPTARCAASAAPETEGRWSAGCGPISEALELLATCGAPSSPELLLETTPPELELVEPVSANIEIAAADTEAEMSVEALAWDAESGLAEVRFEIRDEHGVVRQEERDEVPPYQIERLRLARGTWELSVRALDHASNERQTSLSLLVDDRARLTIVDDAQCALRLGSKPRGPSATWVVVLAFSAFGWYRRSSRRMRRMLPAFGALADAPGIQSRPASLPGRPASGMGSGSGGGQSSANAHVSPHGMVPSGQPPK